MVQEVYWSSNFSAEIDPFELLSMGRWAISAVQDQDLGVNRKAGVSIKPGAASPRINFSIRIHNYAEYAA